MEEPTRKQYKILQKAYVTDGLLRKGKEEDIEDIYILVRSGYLNNLVVMSGEYEWRFKITEKGEEYIHDDDSDLPN